MGQTQSPSLKENILIVDDNPTNLNLLKEILSGQGYKVRAALSAQVALKSAELTLPDLILLDILMPDMDGYQACKQLKASSATKDIPIIFISALSEVMDKVEAFSLGGVDYITKPFQAQEVLARVENQLRLQRLSNQLLEQNKQLEQELRERQRAEQALRENQSLLTGIIEGTTDQIAALDRNFRYITFNSSYQAEFRKLFGREIEIGTNLMEALAHVPEAQAKFLEMWQRALAGEQFTLIQEFGDRNYYEITYSSIKDKNGQLLGASHIIKNVSDRIRSEQALRDSERRLMFALSGAKAGSWELNPSTSQGIWSDENFKLMGYEPGHGNVHYDSWLQRIHPDDRERVDRQLKQTLEEKSELALEYRVLLPDNTIRWLRAIGKFIDNEPGNSNTIAGIQLDITERKQLEDKLAHQKELLDAFFRSAHVGMCAVDDRMRYFLVNEALADANGISVADHMGKTPWDIVPDLALKQETVFRQVLATGQPVPQFELSGQTNKLPGITRTWLNSYFPIHNPNNQPMGIGIVVVEITQRKAAEAALRESEERFRNAFDYAAIGMALVALDGRFLKVNPVLGEITGYSEEELLATTFQSITHPADLETDLADVNQLLTGEIRFYQIEKRYCHKQGHIGWILLSCSLVRDERGQPLYFIGQIQDISDRKQAEDLIKASLQEKEVLLKEIHHRVKNNLQIVSSLLQMQSRRTQDLAASLVLQDSQNRIKSIALVHEKLYRSDDLANINFSQYIPDLTSHLFDSYQVSSDAVSLYTNIDGIFLEIDRAIPCGLIINELVSNSLKYAFPKHCQGEIWVEFHVNSDDTLALIVRDNGIGIPASFDIETSTSLGLTLVQGLTEQLEGTLEVNCSNGTEFKITFPAGGRR